MKVSIDQEGCISCGLCVSTCPDLFEFNEDEKAVPITENVPAELEDDAKDAADGCPVSVIFVEK